MSVGIYKNGKFVKIAGGGGSSETAINLKTQYISSYINGKLSEWKEAGIYFFPGGGSGFTDSPTVNTFYLINIPKKQTSSDSFLQIVVEANADGTTYRRSIFQNSISKWRSYAMTDEVSEYEKGEWNPIVYSKSNVQQNSVYINQAIYTKIGNIVFIHCMLDARAGTQLNYITGLPFSGEVYVGQIVMRESGFDDIKYCDVKSKQLKLNVEINIQQNEQFYISGWYMTDE